jgi:predicted house-cleaning noncanonical NTP pyrophosphatase (MazG superfamily)
MRLPIIKHVSNFIQNNDEDYIVETLEVFEDLIDARGLKDEELDVIGELMSNMEGALEVQKLIKGGMTQKEALNDFMKRVMSIGK